MRLAGAQVKTLLRLREALRLRLPGRPTASIFCLNDPPNLARIEQETRRQKP